MTDNLINDIFTRLDRRLGDIESLVDNIDLAPGQMRATISRVAVEGRSITNILQNLRSKVNNFDDWYQDKENEMRNDPLLRFFYQLRTETLKRGVDKIGGVQVKPQPNSSIQINQKGFTVTTVLENGEVRKILHPKPDNTVGTFMGDQNGGSGFVVKMPDGREKKHYVFIPPDAADISVFFKDPPKEHMDKELNNSNPRVLCRLYYGYLKHLCNEAKEKFKK